MTHYDETTKKYVASYPAEIKPEVVAAEVAPKENMTDEEKAQSHRDAQARYMAKQQDK